MRGLNVGIASFLLSSQPNIGLPLHLQQASTCQSVSTSSVVDDDQTVTNDRGIISRSSGNKKDDEETRLLSPPSPLQHQPQPATKPATSKQKLATVHLRPTPHSKKQFLSKRLKKILDLCAGTVSATNNAATPTTIAATNTKPHDQTDNMSSTSSTTKPTNQLFTFADIGCDHCQLGVALLQSGMVDRVIAVDRMEAPLRRGIETAMSAAAATVPDIHNNGIEDNTKSAQPVGKVSSNRIIEFRLGDGLEPLEPQDNIQTICIAGMGVRSILDILEGSLSSSNNSNNNCHDGGNAKNDQHKQQEISSVLRTLGVNHLLLQPVDPHPQYMIALRRWLLDRGWSIRDETITRNGKRLYLNIWASFDDHDDQHNHKERISPYDEEDLVLPVPLRRRIYSSSSSSSTTQEDKPAGVDVSSNHGRNDEDEDEVELWRKYVQKYGSWASSARRSDQYDQYVGVSREKIAKIFAKEEQIMLLG